MFLIAITNDFIINVGSISCIHKMTNYDENGTTCFAALANTGSNRLLSCCCKLKAVNPI